MGKPQRHQPVDGPPPDDPLPGMKLGDYVVERAVASGGMGIVYVATHPLLKRKVAVKVLRPEYARNAEQVKRFLAEAQAISAIRHRGIIDVISFGDLPDRRQYMVMEFLEGESLEQLLERESPLPAVRALPIIDEVLDALSAAHQVGVVHRDLKPSNVFMTLQSNGARYAKLVDFGLAKQSAIGDEDGPRAAKASLVAGTPEYISPEQARGLAPTPRTDLYCLGVMMFEMLTGGLPFAAGSLMELLQKHVYEPAPRLSQFITVPDSLDDLVASLLEKAPEDRPRSAEVVRQAVGRVMKEIKEASTQHVSRPLPLARPSAPGRPAPVGLSGPAPLAEPVIEDTHVRGSDPGMAKQIAQVRERASGPSGKRKKPEVGRARLEQRVKATPAGEVSPALELPRPPETQPTPAVGGRRNGLLVGAGVGAAVLLGAVALLALGPQAPAVAPLVPVGSARPKPVPPPEAQPAKPPLTEAELKAGLAAATAKEEQAAAEAAKRKFIANLGGATLRPGLGKDPAGHLQKALKLEGEEHDTRAAESEKKLTSRQKAVREVTSELETRPECDTNWKGEARKKITGIRDIRLKALDPTRPDLSEALQQVREDAAGLMHLVNTAKTRNACTDALVNLDSWANAR